MKLVIVGAAIVGLGCSATSHDPASGHAASGDSRAVGVKYVLLATSITCDGCEVSYVGPKSFMYSSAQPICGLDGSWVDVVEVFDEALDPPVMTLVLSEKGAARVGMCLGQFDSDPPWPLALYYGANPVGVGLAVNDLSVLTFELDRQAVETLEHYFAAGR